MMDGGRGPFGGLLAGGGLLTRLWAIGEPALGALMGRKRFSPGGAGPGETANLEVVAVEE